MKTFLIVLVFASTTRLSLSATGTAGVPYYYWRDYTGMVPNDAIAGGVDSNGRTTYIAQIAVPAIRDPTGLTVEVLPAVLHAENMSLYASYNDFVISSKPHNTSVKILCAPQSMYFTITWNKPSSGLPAAYNYVIVGYESFTPLYLGREEVNNEIIIGKLNSNDGDGLVAVYNGYQIRLFNYTLLAYRYNG